MFIIDVIPLTNISIGQSQVFSYFSKENIKRGCLVEVLFNNRKIMAVVLKSENIASKKAIIKKSDFSLKPINEIIATKPSIPPLFFILADFIARYYFVSASFSFKAILPTKIKSLSKYINNLSPNEFKGYFKISKPLEFEKIIKIKRNYSFTNDFLILVNNIEKNLKKKKQILILVPTTLYQEYYINKLETLLKEKIYLVSPNLKVKEFNSLWSLINNQKALLVMGRRSSIFLPWQDLGLIVVIDANNTSYKSWDQKPYYNTITLVNYLSLYYESEITYYQNY